MQGSGARKADLISMEQGKSFAAQHIRYWWSPPSPSLTHRDDAVRHAAHRRHCRQPVDQRHLHAAAVAVENVRQLPTHICISCPQSLACWPACLRKTQPSTRNAQPMPAHDPLNTHPPAHPPAHPPTHPSTYPPTRPPAPGSPERRSPGKGRPWQQSGRGPAPPWCRSPGRTAVPPRTGCRAAAQGSGARMLWFWVCQPLSGLPISQPGSQAGS